jgi:cation diffusion facilitator CzcD-associated flavoprotein CzcO
MEMELDAVIVGAGFSGIYLLHRLRDQLNLNVKIIDAGSDVGGTWHWNKYPGARVDCPAPVYGFNIEEVWKTWNWSEVYPAQHELQAYFQHVDRTLSVSKDCIFNSRVVSAQFDASNWTIKTDNGQTMLAKYFIPAVGFASQQYVPSWKGIDSFRGTIHHSSHWPEEVDVRGKRVAIIGTGSTGVQIVQEWAKEASETFVFQRTPNLCLPMHQKSLDPITQDKMRAETAELFSRCWETAGGLPYDGSSKLFADYSPEECDKALNQLYDEGGFRFWGGAYMDLLLNPEGNRAAYDVWAKRTRERINDPMKRDLLAPLNPPHPFGAKRPSLEQDYFEQFNKPNVHVIDTNAHPIVEVTSCGIVTADGNLHEVDVIAIATGFDASTGSLGSMGICDIDGVDLGKHWRKGVSTFLGLMVPRFPNMFLPYSVQAPTPFTNGPVFIEFQANFIRDMIKKMQSDGIQAVEPHSAAVQDWQAQMETISKMTLFSKAKSWYTGANIPGKPVELLYYYGGIPRYRDACGDAIARKFQESFSCHI